MHASNRADRPRGTMTRRRRGSVTIEMLLLLPVLLVVILGAVELSLMVAANQQLEFASGQGARVAAQGGDHEEIERVVRRALGEGRLRDAEVRVALTDEHGRPLSTGDAVEVVVHIQANRAVPDLLRFIGFSLKDIVLSGRTVMRME